MEDKLSCPSRVAQNHLSGLYPFPASDDADFDIRHRLTLSIAYDLPSRKSLLQMVQGRKAASICSGGPRLRR